MKENKYIVNIDDIERRIIVRALSDLKDKQKEQNKSYDFLDDLIVKICDAQKERFHLFNAR